MKSQPRANKVVRSAKRGSWAKGQWEVENHGIAPDVEVELDPKLVREGHDPQLERAVEVVLDLLKRNPPPTYPKPAYPNYHDTLPVPVR